MQNKSKQFGGVALEYLIVSLVTLGMSFAAVKIVKTAIKEKLSELSNTMGELPEGDGAWQDMLD